MNKREIGSGYEEMAAAYLIEQGYKIVARNFSGRRGEIDIIARLSEQLDKANARADLAERRADAAYKERNDAFQMMGELKAKISGLETQVQMLREKLDGKAT